MIIEKVVAPKLALFSYFVADGSYAVVIDPKRDVEDYLRLAQKHNKKIIGIFETHRHEDHILGSKELASLTGAEIYRSAYEDLGYEDGLFMKDGETFAIGSLTLKALHTPGHTKGHMVFALYNGEKPLVVFSGDALFYGDVGRTDFYGKENLPEMTAKAYDSIHNVILGLGEDVILMPAHGPGSACGGAIADMPFSTLGHEKATSPVFAVEDKEAFIKKYGIMRYKPPYFTKMEKCNVHGAPFVGNSVDMTAVEIGKVMDVIKDRRVIDVRPEGQFTYHHLPGALFMGGGVFTMALGALIPTEDEIILVTDGLSKEEVETAYWTLRRMGYDNIVGFVGDKVHLTLEIQGTSLPYLDAISVKDFKKIQNDKDWINVDVRGAGQIGAKDISYEKLNIPLTDLPKRFDEVGDKKFATSCKTGISALAAASYLVAHGKEGVNIRGNLDKLDN